MDTQAKKRTSKLAVASLTLAILGVLTVAAGVGILFFLAAIFCGHAGLRAIKRADGSLQGRDAARVGLGISYGLMIAGAIWVPFIIKENNERVAAVKQALAEREGGTTQTATDTDGQKPLPPTRTEEMQQRVEAFVKRGGDPAAAKLVEDNLELIKKTENQAGEMLAAYQALDVETIFRPDLANKEKINNALAGTERLEKAALSLKDTAVIHRERMLGTATENIGTDVASEVAEKTGDNYRQFIAWSDSALAFTPLAKRLLKDYGTTGQMDQNLVELAFERATEYEEIQEELVTKSAKQQAEFEKTMPR